MTKAKERLNEWDKYGEAKASTERITTLNDKRRLWVRIQFAAHVLNEEHYKLDGLEKQLVTLLTNVENTARARIKSIDTETDKAMAEHERIMQRILEGD